MSQLLKRRGEAEHAIKALESLYTQTVVPSWLHPSFLAAETFSVEHFVLHVFQKFAADFRERISDKYSRIRFVLDADERLMMQIIEAEETYMTDWLESQRSIMETQIQEIDSLRTRSKLLLQQTNDLKFLQVSPNNHVVF